MIKRNYKVISSEAKGFTTKKIDLEKLENELNMLGEIGWDLVASDCIQSNGSTSSVIYILKNEGLDIQ